MNINIEKKENVNLIDNEVKVIIQYAKKNKEVNDLEKYIHEFKERKKEIFVEDNYNLIPILRENIIKIYSIGKSNYCKTVNAEYKIKSKLYEIEKMDKNFIRISKSCIVNILHIECFDLSNTGKILIKLDNNTEEIASRRRAREILFYLDERRL